VTALPRPVLASAFPQAPGPGPLVTNPVDPDWIWWWRCRTCDIASGPTDSGPEVLHLAAVHDRLHHRGQRTAGSRCVPAIPPTGPTPEGSDLPC
jgi:hypothetical protein